MAFSSEWIEILNEISEFQKGKHYTWFRGQSDSDYKLNSGLYRTELDDPDMYIATEHYRYTSFERMGHIHHKENNWNLLFLMQHHRVKTRLLDWTESFAVSLYFATTGWDYEKNDCAIWILDPLKLNKITLGNESFYLPKESYESFFTFKTPYYKNSLAVYPLRNSDRIIAQQGMFTMQGIAGVPLEEENHGELFNEKVLKKITLSKKVQNDIKLYLKHSGISHYSVFPDLDRLADSINEEGYFSRPLSR